MRFLICLLIFAGALFADEEQKKNDVSKNYNLRISELKQQIQSKYNQFQNEYQKAAGKDELRIVYEDIQQMKQRLLYLQEEYRKERKQELDEKDEGYAFWDQGETTLSQLVMDYGSGDYLYVIPAEIAAIKIHLYSMVPIPKENWDEMLEMILIHNGIGARKLNPFLKQLYVLKQDLQAFSGIATDRKDLLFLSDHSQLCYVFSPNFEQLKLVQAFFERFTDVKQSSIHIIGTKIVIVAAKQVIERLLDLYEAVWVKEREGKKIKALSLSKVSAQEAEKMVKAFFVEQPVKARPNFFSLSSIEELIIIPQGSNLILIGESTLVDRAEKLVLDVEKQLKNPHDMVIYLYHCKNSDPEYLANVLSQVYGSLSNMKNDKLPLSKEGMAEAMQGLPVSPKFMEPGKITPYDGSKGIISNNFIVDSKLGTILMVVKGESLPQLKELLERLDVPKKMVQIDILLIEKKIHEREQTGINLFKLGSSSGNSNFTGLSFDANFGAKRKGILDLILSRSQGKLPPFDLTLNFLMSQENVKINANPSVLAVNQTPATIYIVDEVSINNGAVEVDTTSGKKTEKSFIRAQYGITIVMTPTVHIPEEGQGFITLQTNVTFDTTPESMDERPPVTRRHIENEVRVADGETVILGGLRRKVKEDFQDKIPFLGDIPGFGKLFGSTKVADSATEMFIFITPRIIKDPIEDIKKVREEELQKRPGDIPEFLERLQMAKTEDKKRLFEDSLNLIFEENDRR